MTARRLGVGFVGSGFNARFHMLGWKGVRDADVLGVWSPNTKNATSAARYANELDVGRAGVYGSIAEMVADPAIDAIWLTGPNQARIENVQEICDAVVRGKGELKGIACEKPLARNVAEANEVVRLVKSAGLMHGYLEDQVFAPQVEAGRDLLWARGA
ncbi:MAG TPA: Gfo/Idh/MocA family oxidoreductase, partial [Gemmatimonadaceae bacterium]|nr:Gfo/Idh/MocA family oxidoreductase [Gemmatimonadaceae bacterium]